LIKNDYTIDTFLHQNERLSIGCWNLTTVQ